MARKVARRVTAKEVLDLGLKVAGANDRQRNTSLTTQLRRFKTCYGSDPLVYARIWADLAQIDVEQKLVYFLSACTGSKGTIRSLTWH
jgi:hypothetical protein